MLRSPIQLNLKYIQDLILNRLHCLSGAKMKLTHITLGWPFWYQYLK